MKTKDFLVEAKITEKNSFILKRDIWDKISEEAFQIGRKPLMSIWINGKKLTVMEEDLFLEMHEAWLWKKKM